MLPPSHISCTKLEKQVFSLGILPNYGEQLEIQDLVVRLVIHNSYF